MAAWAVRAGSWGCRGAPRQHCDVCVDGFCCESQPGRRWWAFVGAEAGEGSTETRDYSAPPGEPRPRNAAAGCILQGPGFASQQSQGEVRRGAIRDRTRLRKMRAGGSCSSRMFQLVVTDGAVLVASGCKFRFCKYGGENLIPVFLVRRSFCDTPSGFLIIESFRHRDGLRPAAASGDSPRF